MKRLMDTIWKLPIWRDTHGGRGSIGLGSVQRDTRCQHRAVLPDLNLRVADHSSRILV